MLTNLYWSIVNNEIKMPNQLTDKKNVVIELSPQEKHDQMLLKAVQTHVALLKSARQASSSFDHCRSSDIVSTLFRCLWLEFYIYLDNVLLKGHLRALIVGLALDTLRFCLMTCWSLEMDLPEKAFIDILRRATASLREIVSNESLNEVNCDLDIVCNEKAESITRMMHMGQLIFHLKELFAAAINARQVEDKMELFVPGSVPPSDDRQYLYDHSLTKITHKGVRKEYTVSLFLPLCSRAVLPLQRRAALREAELPPPVRPPPHRPARELRAPGDRQARPPLRAPRHHARQGHPPPLRRFPREGAVGASAARRSARFALTFRTPSSPASSSSACRWSTGPATRPFGTSAPAR